MRQALYVYTLSLVQIVGSPSTKTLSVYFGKRVTDLVSFVITNDTNNDSLLDRNPSSSTRPLPPVGLKICPLRSSSLSQPSLDPPEQNLNDKNIGNGKTRLYKSQKIDENKYPLTVNRYSFLYVQLPKDSMEGREPRGPSKNKGPCPTPYPWVTGTGQVGKERCRVLSVDVLTRSLRLVSRATATTVRAWVRTED